VVASSSVLWLINVVVILVQTPAHWATSVPRSKTGIMLKPEGPVPVFSDDPEDFAALYRASFLCLFALPPHTR
jgi:hypothetical protein